MQKLRYIFAGDLSPKFVQPLKRRGIPCEYARANFLNTIDSLISYCIVNNLVVVTQNKKLFRKCCEIRHPVILLQDKADRNEIQRKISHYTIAINILRHAA